MKTQRKPLLETVERQYGKPIEQVIADLYAQTENFDKVATMLGTTRQTLYRWIGLERMQAIRARHMLKGGGGH